MPLVRREIIDQIKRCNILITPYSESNVKANSYDISLARTLYRITDKELDLKKPYNFEKIVIPESGYVLQPGEFYLGVTREWTFTEKFVPILEGRSTSARYNLVIHQTAGFGDVGFAGHWTLEITVTIPTRIYPNIRIGQIYFEPISTIFNTESLYAGKYTNEYSDDPNPSVAQPGNF